MKRMTGIWEMTSGPQLRDSDHTTSMLAVLRAITMAIPPDAPLVEATIQLGAYRWQFRRLSPLTLVEGPDGWYAVLGPEVEA